MTRKSVRKEIRKEEERNKIPAIICYFIYSWCIVIAKSISLADFYIVYLYLFRNAMFDLLVANSFDRNQLFAYVVSNNWHHRKTGKELGMWKIM